MKSRSRDGPAAKALLEYERVVRYLPHEASLLRSLLRCRFLHSPRVFSPAVKTQQTRLDKIANQVHTRSRRSGEAEAATNYIHFSRNDHEICVSFHPLLLDG